jgi:hypothetical protein
MSHYGKGLTPEQEGYLIREGRLINKAPTEMSGIQKLAMIKKGMKRADKVSMMTEAIELAEMKKNIRGMF